MTKCSITAIDGEITCESLFSNLESLLANKDFVTNTPKYYYIRVENAFLGGAKSCQFFLGDLLNLWTINYDDNSFDSGFRNNDNGAWVRNLNDEICYVYQVNGSPLSGSCYAKIYNSKLKTYSSLYGNNFSRYCLFVGSVINERLPLFYSKKLFDELLLKIL